MGRRLVEMLLVLGHSVIAHDLRPFDLSSSPNSEFRIPNSAFDNIPNSTLETVSGDLVKGEGLEQIANSDVVVHLAAAGVKTGSRQWDLCTSVNVVGTQALLSALGRCQKMPMLFYSRTYYQDHLSEIPSLWENPYLATKEASTRLVKRWKSQDCPDARIVIGTFFQAYGPGDDPNNLVSYTIRKLLAGEPAEYGSGTALRDWIYVDDLVTGIIAAIDSARTAEDPGLHHYDLGTGKGYPIQQVVKETAHLLGVNPIAYFDPARDRSDSGITHLAKDLVPGWAPHYTLESGLAQTIRTMTGTRP